MRSIFCIFQLLPAATGVAASPFSELVVLHRKSNDSLAVYLVLLLTRQYERKKELSLVSRLDN
jgi:hypothetical protein